MYLIENEIFTQHEALQKTFEKVMSLKGKISEFFHAAEGITFVGCGSSYSLCRSAELSLKKRSNKKVNSVAAGDFLLHFDDYKSVCKNNLVVIVTRSGSTSEVVQSVKRAKAELNTKTILICLKEKSDLHPLADLSIELPWAFDYSVCQTRSVTNLYLANLMCIALATDDSNLITEIKKALDSEKSFIEYNKNDLKFIAENISWEKVVILADSDLEGIAQEGALAFNEICRKASTYNHILDVRHGPIVLVDNRTLAIIICTSKEIQLQNELISDIKRRGAYVLTVSNLDKKTLGSDYNVKVPNYTNTAVYGIPFIYVPQVISFYKALANDVNPDQPEGLSAWIKL